ncbi:hypothetical protein, partial [Hominisplanchenecus murintestinalis]|uniref:hypothetical protein n=1 Tax=Hominisplanchenecus murintestinalis TaxID=2941517 RepID=UPI00203D2347
CDGCSSDLAEKHALRVSPTVSSPTRCPRQCGIYGRYPSVRSRYGYYRFRSCMGEAMNSPTDRNLTVSPFSASTGNFIF